MTDQKAKVILGGLLHDIGKVIYRQGDDRRNHSVSGCDYLKEEAGITDQEILNCVRYHHWSELKYARISENDIAYIVYLADNIAAFSERREKDTIEEKGFEVSVPLQSVFNHLNGNHQEFYYPPADLDPKRGILFPEPEKKKFSEEFYKIIKIRMTENLRGLYWSEEYINSLLSVLEANLSYVPSSTIKTEVTDISLFDHVKLTAALSACIYDYLKEKEVSYKERLQEKANEFYSEKAFLIGALDFSGIQNFIYTITTKNALRTLRARSFYLEIMMEQMVDSLLESLELSRVNLLYAGGGHCYLLLPNTQNTYKKIEEYERKVKKWFLEHFQTELFVAFGWTECSADNLRNKPEGSYGEIFQKIARMLSWKKQHRYCAEEIIMLNKRRADDYTRECKVCKKIGHVDEEGVCQLCRKIENLSKDVLYSDFFSVVLEEEGEGLPLPTGCLLVADNEASLRKRMEKDPYFVRAYAKNKMYTGRHIATKLWVGDYTTGDTFQEFAEKAQGIGRIGILRADVDNLGQAFVAGFHDEKNGDKYATLSRTASLSRQLSMFFKYFIRFILENGEYQLGNGEFESKRNATIIYSGGDDLFIAGAWNEIIELSIDLKEQFERYTQGTLSVSAGIGVYEPSYPISAIAQETGNMEEKSKNFPGKKAVTLMEDGEKHKVDDCENDISDGTYSWAELKEEVLGEKYQTLEVFFDGIEERGMAFLYRMLELIRNQKDKINFARFVYLLSRLEPNEEGEAKEHYRQFSKKMYQWIQSEKDCRQLKTAMNLYAYIHREKGEE
jgi:CRISPR-associated protein Cas10/Csm1 subtype III-A